MLALVHTDPGEHLHVVDLPYRLSSWAFDHPENIALWTDPQDRLMAWAVLQPPFGTIDYAYHPALAATDLQQQILAWADHRARQAVNSPGGSPAWFVTVLPHQTQQIHNLEALGFTCQSHVAEDPYAQVLMTRPLAASESEGPLPLGFVLRPLAGAAEVDAYVALHQAVFQSENMTPGWRHAILQHPAYRPDLDLVIEAPDGRLAAFCIGWFAPKALAGQPCGQIEPLGVHADFRRRGLAKALLSACFQRLHHLGAQQVLVETDNYRDAALQVYEAVGFQVQHAVLVYRKDYGPQE